MNSTNERRSNARDGNEDPNASVKQEETNTEQEEVDVINETDNNERSRKTSVSEKEAEEDVGVNIIRQTMHRLWETNNFLEESYKMDLEVRQI